VRPGRPLAAAPRGCAARPGGTASPLPVFLSLAAEATRPTAVVGRFGVLVGARRLGPVPAAAVLLLQRPDQSASRVAILAPNGAAALRAAAGSVPNRETEASAASVKMQASVPNGEIRASAASDGK
jgi:hypothetical protein